MISFDVIQESWKQGIPLAFKRGKRIVPSLESLDDISLKFITRTVSSVTVEIDGIQDCVSNPDDAPRLKSFLIQWFKGLFGVKQSRSASQSLILQLSEIPARKPDEKKSNATPDIGKPARVIDRRKI